MSGSARTTPPAEAPHIDAPAGTETTGHEWDGIQELNNPLPRWWLWTFYATIVWALGYVIAYPAIPLVSSATQGVLGWSSRQEVAHDMARADEARREVMERIRDLPLAEIRADETLMQAAFRGGESAFKVNCSQCHGSGAEGGPGYANLNDDEWIWGGTLEEIAYTIRHGVRFEQDVDSRYSLMPSFGADGILDRAEITAATHYVLSLSGAGHDAGEAAAGADVYADNCASCHGAAGEGMRELGAPALNDQVWLHGGTAADIASQISRPRHGVMPGWQGRLDDLAIKQLALFVHALGGGLPDTP